MRSAPHRACRHRGWTVSGSCAAEACNTLCCQKATIPADKFLLGASTYQEPFCAPLFWTLQQKRLQHNSLEYESPTQGAILAHAWRGTCDAFWWLELT